MGSDAESKIASANDFDSAVRVARQMLFRASVFAIGGCLHELDPTVRSRVVDRADNVLLTDGQWNTARQHRLRVASIATPSSVAEFNELRAGLQFLFKDGPGGVAEGSDTLDGLVSIVAKDIAAATSTFDFLRRPSIHGGGCTCEACTGCSSGKRAAFHWYPKYLKKCIETASAATAISLGEENTNSVAVKACYALSGMTAHHVATDVLSACCMDINGRPQRTWTISEICLTGS